ncbi:glucokinase [Microbulbifer bruguierae]|uniref:Glucokinase n=1 Tax=Microbulbifer bruguierae TaxID=3029061 RepID=A0ABY8NHN3_9GAMM|nr:glucokinase [Microbulbifer bruguierae]WGL18436.1 glucokinase [Microbulbifer bruguierae]
MSRIVADIGGTNARFAIAHPYQGGYRLEDIQVVNCAKFADFYSALGQWLEGLEGERPRQACIAVAGPVEKTAAGGRVTMTNLGWDIRAEELCARFRLDRALVVNDFAALALSLPRLPETDKWALRDVPAQQNGPMVVVGPGTGLGVAALVHDGGNYRVVPGEGGHANLPAGSERELELLRILARDQMPVYNEYVLSGGGLVNLYRAVCALHGRPAEDLTPPDVSGRGLDGSDPLCRETLIDFLNFLGSAAGDAALYYVARGGVFLGGGVLPRIESLLPESEFEQRFTAKGRLGEWLKGVRVEVLKAGYPALIGAAAWLEN